LWNLPLGWEQSWDWFLHKKKCEYESDCNSLKSSKQYNFYIILASIGHEIFTNFGQNDMADKMANSFLLRQTTSNRLLTTIYNFKSTEKILYYNI